MTRLLSIFLLAVMFSGCEMIPFLAKQSPQENKPKKMMVAVKHQDPASKIEYQPDSRDSQVLVEQVAPYWVTPNHVYMPRFSHKNLGEYAEQIAMKLYDSGVSMNPLGTIGIASFVLLDSNLQTTNSLGNQLAEMLMTEMQQFGLPVVDAKSLGGMTVTQAGDFVFSRNQDEDRELPRMDYILSGTMINHERGVQVNARVIAISSGIVVASAKTMIPAFMVESLQPRFVIVN